MAEEKYVPQSMTQEEWDIRKPAPTPLPPFEDPNEPDDFEEVFLANLNENSRRKTPEAQAEYDEHKYPGAG